VTDPKGPVTLAPPHAAADLTTVPGALTLDLVVTKSIGMALGVSKSNFEFGHNSGFGNGVGVGKSYIYRHCGSEIDGIRNLKI
jgi:hypothetical protein